MPSHKLITPVTTSSSRSFDPDLKLVASTASCASLLAFLYYFQRSEILLYGDAVAHINIARRVFDSQTPGLLQLGTVWLPLPHLLMIPLLLSDWMWRTGIGGSIPSMIAYVLGVAGIFRLTRSLLEGHEPTRQGARAGGWLAALAYGVNPNLIYLQTTAMTEPIYLALFVWAAAYFAEFLRFSTPESMDIARARRVLYRSAFCVVGAELSRYDGWFLGVLMGIIMLILTARRWSNRAFRVSGAKFMIGIAAAPLLWFAYNAAVYGNPLEFANGPYSAKAIEQRTAQPGYPAHPGAGNVVTGASFFLKSAQLNMADGNWGRIWIVIALLGSWAGRKSKARLVFLLLWLPVAFYGLSIAYSGVPLFVPTWWPFTWYNLRYGLQLLPLFAVSVGLIGAAVLSMPEPSRAGRVGALIPRFGIALVLIVIAVSCFSVWKSQPLCFKEAWVNSRTKLSLESSLAKTVAAFPTNARYLMYIGDHVGVFQQAGIPLRQVINEGNHRPWKKPADPDGLWERALADPSAHVDFVIAYEGDAVDQSVNRTALSLFQEIHTSGQPRARIYTVHAGLNQSR